MKIVDLNVLLYAVNVDSAHHTVAKDWLEGALQGEEAIGLPWVVLLGFLRLATSRRIFPNPLAVAEAVEVAEQWLSNRVVELVNPGDDHWQVLAELLDAAGTAGNLTTDAHLAALALERRAQLVSMDSDFARFADLRWVNPLVSH